MIDDLMNYIDAGKIDLEKIRLDKEDPHKTLYPLLVSRARKAESEGNLHVSIASNEKIIDMYSDMVKTPQIWQSIGYASSHLARLYVKEDENLSEFYSLYELSIFTDLKGHMDEKERLSHIVYPFAHLMNLGGIKWIEYYKSAFDTISAEERGNPDIVDMSARIHYMLGKKYMKTDPDAALNYLGQTIGLIEKIPDAIDSRKFIFAKAHSIIGSILYDKNNILSEDFEEAMKHKMIAVSVMEDLEDVNPHRKNQCLMNEYMTLANMNYRKFVETNDDIFKDNESIYFEEALILGNDLLDDPDFTRNENFLKNYEFLTHKLGLIKENNLAKHLLENILGPHIPDPPIFAHT